MCKNGVNLLLLWFFRIFKSYLSCNKFIAILLNDIIFLHFSCIYCIDNFFPNFFTILHIFVKNFKKCLLFTDLWTRGVNIKTFLAIKFFCKNCKSIWFVEETLFSIINHYMING
jgi:hypothetical protein